MKTVSGKKGPATIADQYATSSRQQKPDRNRPGLLTFASLFIGICFLFTSVRFGAAVQPSIPAGVEIRIKAHPETAAIGDPIRIDLEIITPQVCQVEIPEPEQQTGDFFILEFFPGPVIADTDKRETQVRSSERRDSSSRPYQARIVAAVYKTGTFTFPGIPVYITDNDGKRTALQCPSVNVEIQSILSADNRDLRDLKKQADIPDPTRWLLWILIAVAVCLLGAAAWHFRRKYKKHLPLMPSIPDRDPFERAESDLRDLLARNLPGNGHTKKFYVLLSEIVKRILEPAYEIQTAERTTIEIMDSLYRHSGRKPGSLEAVESFLLQCDIVKFAKYIPSEKENDSAAESAFRILSEARNFTINSQVINKDAIALEGRSDNSPGREPREREPRDPQASARVKNNDL
jgi:hypothetical protein